MKSETIELAIEDKNGNQLGYFRDSYNWSCILWQFGGSWWQIVSQNKTDKQRLEALKGIIHFEASKGKAISTMQEDKIQYWEYVMKEEWAKAYKDSLKELNEWIVLAEKTIKQKGKIIWSY